MQPRPDGCFRFPEERKVSAGHHVQKQLLGPWPVAVHRGAADAGLLRDALMGDRGWTLAGQQPTGGNQDRFPATHGSGIGGEVHHHIL